METQNELKFNLQLDSDVMAIIRYTVDHAIEQTLKELGIKPKTRKTKVSINYAVTKMGVGRVRLETAIRKGYIQADYNQDTKRWEVDRASLEKFFKLK